MRQQELMSQIPSIGSYNYAHKELRSLELHIAAQSDFSGEILKLLKNYFMYSFVIDLENIKHAKKVASVIAQQEYFRTHIQEAKKLKLIFDEIAKLQDSKLNLNEDENLQFLTKIRDFINQFDASFKKHKPKNKLGGK